MKVLLATDGTKYSQEAVNMVSQLDLTTKSEIKIITVIDMAPPFSIDAYAGYAPSMIEMENIARDHAEKVLTETRNQLLEHFSSLAIPVTTEVFVGSPESIIVEAAEEMHANLIVIGSHGYNRWERLLLGSVSDSVVRHAPCSVLVARIHDA